jgi:hypothetical protein
MSTFKTTITREIDVTVHYRYIAAQRGARVRPAKPLPMTFSAAPADDAIHDDRV